MGAGFFVGVCLVYGAHGVVPLPPAALPGARLLKRRTNGFLGFLRVVQTAPCNAPSAPFVHSVHSVHPVHPVHHVRARPCVRACPCTSIYPLFFENSPFRIICNAFLPFPQDLFFIHYSYQNTLFCVIKDTFPHADVSVKIYRRHFSSKIFHNFKDLPSRVTLNVTIFDKAHNFNHLSFLLKIVMWVKNSQRQKTGGIPQNRLVLSRIL
jgi:hypothetical protein